MAERRAMQPCVRRGIGRFCLRLYRSSDLPAMALLFCETICSVNACDYSPDQICAWSARWRSLLERDADFRATHTVVAVPKCPGHDPGVGQGRTGAPDGLPDGLVGFGNINRTGYLDLLYVHKDWQGRGIATALCDELEHFAREAGAGEATTHASITARPFFERRGYAAMHAQTVVLEGVELTNFAMAKPL